MGASTANMHVLPVNIYCPHAFTAASHSFLIQSTFFIFIQYYSINVPPPEYISAPSTWTIETLKDLGMLPLYLSSTFYDLFDKVSST